MVGVAKHSFSIRCRPRYVESAVERVLARTSQLRAVAKVNDHVGQQGPDRLLYVLHKQVASKEKRILSGNHSVNKRRTVGDDELCVGDKTDWNAINLGLWGGTYETFLDAVR